MTCYVKLAVEGIQKYICATGRLKEMIGGSEIINSIAEPAFYSKHIPAGLVETGNVAGLAGHYIVAQANAGALCVIFPDRESARSFLRSASEALLRDYPGLPFFTALVEFELSETGEEAYREARKKADDLIRNERAQAAVPEGCGLLPILAAARLDGLAAAAIIRENGQQERYSLLSLAKTQDWLIGDARERLRSIVPNSPGVSLEWEDDLEKLLGGEKSKVALICIDGNDLGKLFGSFLKTPQAGANAGEVQKAPESLTERIARMKSLSRLVRDANEGAFRKACQMLIEYQLKVGAFKIREEKGEKVAVITMPVRPLVMGGDDLTVIAEAGVGLAFASAFAAAFEEIGRQYHLSVGIGMVIMDASYPFAKAFPLAESLQDSAKTLTAHLPREIRPSSIDYLVLTEDVEQEEKHLRERIFRAADKARLTGKPFTVSTKPEIPDFIPLKMMIREGILATAGLARSQLREAWTLCRKGEKGTQAHWLNLRENVSRRLGGNKDGLLSAKEFETIFPAGYFRKASSARPPHTLLGDYLELDRLLPPAGPGREDLLKLMEWKSDV